MRILIFIMLVIISFQLGSVKDKLDSLITSGGMTNYVVVDPKTGDIKEWEAPK